MAISSGITDRVGDAGVHDHVGAAGIRDMVSDIKYCTRVGGSNCYRPLDWTLDEKERVADLIEELIGDASDFDLNLDQLIINGKQCATQDPLIQELIQLIEKGLGGPLCLGAIHPGENGKRAGSGDLFICKGAVLSSLMPEREDVIRVLDKPNLTTNTDHSAEDKSLILNSYCGASHLVEITSQILECRKKAVEAEMGNDPIAIARCKPRLEALEKAIAQMKPKDGKNLPGAVTTLAINPVDISKITDHQERKNAIKRTRDQVRSLIESHSTWRKEILERRYFIWSETEHEKDRTADAVATGCITDRQLASVYGGSPNVPSFFARILQLAATNQDPESYIERSLVDNNYDGIDWDNLEEANHLPFAGIRDASDRAFIRSSLKHVAKEMAQVAAQCKVGTSVPNDKSPALFDAFKTRYDQEFTRRLGTFQTNLQNAAPPQPIPPNGGVAHHAPRHRVRRRNGV